MFSVPAHLFVKVPRPGDSEGTFSVFESRSCLAQGYKQTCRPHYHFKI